MYSDRQVRTMRLIERDVGCKFTRIGPPRVEDVLKASSESATAAIKRVHPDVAEVFLPTAQALLEADGTAAFAAALAHLAGFTQLPTSRSLITHEEVCACDNLRSNLIDILLFRGVTCVKCRERHYDRAC